MADGDALGQAGGAGGEDDPRVVLGSGAGCGGVAGLRSPGDVDGLSGAEHRAHACLAEDEFGPLVRVLGVDRHVGGPGGEDGQDGDVQLVGPGGYADADPVAESDPGLGEGAAPALDLGREGAVGELGGAVVEGGFVGVRPDGRVEDIDERTGRGRGSGGEPGRFAGVLVRLRVVGLSEFAELGCG
ncbi:hypothetical protein BN2537_1499 [Streptomyces venezuelae]|nr:hypothetical protein BN2537_1499 [Streptomyces venezuelae]